MPRPTEESFRIYPDIKRTADDLARRSGWRASEIYIVLVSWVRPRAKAPLCTLDEAKRALEVVIGCATVITHESLGGSSADFRSVLELVQDLATTEVHRRVTP